MTYYYDYSEFYVHNLRQNYVTYDMIMFPIAHYILTEDHAEYFNLLHLSNYTGAQK